MDFCCSILSLCVNGFLWTMSRSSMEELKPSVNMLETMIEVTPKMLTRPNPDRHQHLKKVLFSVSNQRASRFLWLKNIPQTPLQNYGGKCWNYLISNFVWKIFSTGTCGRAFYIVSETFGFSWIITTSATKSFWWMRLPSTHFEKTAFGQNTKASARCRKRKTNTI